jgi:uncharacterized protein YbbK (DUF523 family)
MVHRHALVLVKNECSGLDVPRLPRRLGVGRDRAAKMYEHEGQARSRRTTQKAPDVHEKYKRGKDPKLLAVDVAKIDVLRD